MHKKPSYIFSADIIRSIAIFGVVIIHVVNVDYIKPDLLGGIIWHVSLILYSMFNISVPLFILLSGYFILGKNESFSQSLKRMISRIFVPFVFWVLFYNWWGYTQQKNFFLTQSPFDGKIVFLKVFHLYFLAILISLYFIAPLIRVCLRKILHMPEGVLYKTLLATGIFWIASLFLFNGCASENFLIRWISYLGLFIAGYVLGIKKNKFNNFRLLIIYLFTLIISLRLSYFHYFLSIGNNNLLASAKCLSYYADHYLKIDIIIMSICVFLLLLNNTYENIKKNTVSYKLIGSIARASFGIYLIHPAVTRFLEMRFNLIIDFNSSPTFLIVTKLFFVLILSYLITIFFRQIPIIKILIGETK